MGDDFEPWLEQELRQAVGSVRGASPRAGQAAYRAAAPARRGPLAAVGVKGAVVIAAAALAVGLGASGATAMTGSPNPLSWGQRVVQAVSSCRDQAARDAQPGADAGVPDMGRCVSVFAGQHDGPADPSPASVTAPPSPGRHTPEISPSPLQTGILKRSLQKEDEGQGGDSQTSQGGQTDESAAGDKPKQSVEAKHATRASPKPQPESGGDQ